MHSQCNVPDSKMDSIKMYDIPHKWHCFPLTQQLGDHFDIYCFLKKKKHLLTEVIIFSEVWLIYTKADLK